MSNKTFETNLNLAKAAAIHWSRKSGMSFEDCQQLALIGLYKASMTYDESKGFQFNTYAHRHINNEIITGLKRSKHLFMETEMPTNDEGEEIDIIGEVDSGYDKVDNRISFSIIASKIKQVLTEREWDILYQTSVLKTEQHVIAEKYGIQQPHVSRLLKKIRKDVLDSGIELTIY